MYDLLQGTYVCYKLFAQCEQVLRSSKHNVDQDITQHTLDFTDCRSTAAAVYSSVHEFA